MIAVGSTRKGPLGRMLPGSTAERLLHGAPCPVAVATTGMSADWTPQRVGAGFIDLPSGHEGLTVAGTLAEAAGASLHAVTAIEPIPRHDSAVVHPYELDGRERAVESARLSLEAALKRVPASVPATCAVTAGDAADVLAELSREVDLLVCGSRGYGPIRSVLLGGVTQPLTREARCPLVVVPRGTGQAADQTVRRTTETTA